MMTDILYHDIAVFHFMEHMEAEGVRHVLEFFIAGKNFELSLNRFKMNRFYNKAE
jgi:hypothetical protein